MHADMDVRGNDARSATGSGRLAEVIDAVLPQTQCTRCGYPGCRPYAEAVARGDAAINRCPPGGDEGVRALAALTDQPALQLDPACGEAKPRMLALIDEAHCIGCTICIQKCPVDAIIGAPKQMHAVVAALCTGCDLCVAPCPVDCIAMVPADRGDAGWSDAQRAGARARFERRNTRLASEAALRLMHRPAFAGVSAPEPEASKLAVIRAAVERARAKRASRTAATSRRPADE